MSLAVACFEDEAAAAGRLAAALNTPLTIVRTHRFPDGEILPVVAAPASETVVVYRSLDRPNEKLIELMLAADAWRRAGARRLILAAPYLCYLRQDAVFAPGQPLSRDVVGPLIGARFDAVITVQAHLHRTRDLADVLGTPASNLLAVDVLAAALPAYSAFPLVLGPDRESTPWAAAWAARLHGEAATLRKRREGDRQIEMSLGDIDVAGRPVVIVDDIASSGETLRRATQLAKDADAQSVDIAVVHALMTAAATEQLRSAGARRIVSTDSVAHETNAAELAPMLAEVVRQLAEAP